MSNIFISQNLRELADQKHKGLGKFLESKDLNINYIKGYESLDSSTEDQDVWIIDKKFFLLAKDYLKEQFLLVLEDQQDQVILNFSEELSPNVIYFSEKIDFNDLYGFIKSWYGVKSQSNFQSLLDTATSNLKALTLRMQRHQSFKEGKISKIEKEMSQLFQMLNSIDEDWEFEKELKSYIKRNENIGQLDFVSIYPDTGETINYFPITKNEKDIEIINLSLEFKDEVEKDYYAISLINVLNEVSKKRYYIAKIKEQVKLWGDVFAHMPYPVAIFENDGELLYHNSLYSKLNILSDECFSLKGGKEFLGPEKTYKIVRKVYEISSEQYHLFVFLSGQLDGNLVDTEQLGIITSSVAHELNNPLAGILAAISILELEDNLNQEMKSSLEEMKLCASRCKGLVETFLGFSKFHLDRLDGNLTLALNQSLDLLRFRMIESNIKLHLDLEKKIKDPFKKTNLSIMTMVLYLLFGELLTAYSHYMLLTFNQNSKDNKINVSVYTFEVGLKLKVTPYFDFITQVQDSKLLNYLAEIENYELRPEKDQIILAKKGR